MDISSRLPVLPLSEYRKVVRDLPRPTGQQMRAFAEDVSEARSWYKYIPIFPPGAPFTFFLSPWAGLYRRPKPGGGVELVPSTEKGPHRKAYTTERIRELFGYLSWACFADGDWRNRFPGSEAALEFHRSRVSFHLGEDKEYQLPPEVFDAGTVWLTGLISPWGGLSIYQEAYVTHNLGSIDNATRQAERERLLGEVLVATNRAVDLAFN